jgi:thiamine-phosphate pyrophosphorylase
LVKILLASLAAESCQTWGVDDPRERLRTARLYLVCDDRPDEFLEAALRGGVDAVQLRMKDARDYEILAAARRFAEACAAYGALFILNDRPELVAAAGAHGVHLGQDDLPVSEARRLLGSEAVVGLSTHTPEQIDTARDVDYIGVGPVHATPTKPERPAVGLGLLAYAAAHAKVPCFAIGGINADTVESVRGAGAERVAVVRALTEASDPGAVARQLRGVLERRQEALVGPA